MYWSNCGKLNSDDAKYCTSCGNRLFTDTAGGRSEQKSDTENRQYSAPHEEKKATDQDKTSILGIIALVAAFLIPIAGLVMGLIDYNNKDGHSKEISKWAIIASGIMLILKIIARIVLNSIYSRALVDIFEYFL